MRGLHHIEIYVSDLKESAQFWGWLLEKLGYQSYQEWEHGKSWKCGNTYIVFVQVDRKYLDVPYHRKRVGLNHLAFHVESALKLEKIKNELLGRGTQLLYPDKKINQSSIFFEDPNRIKVELIASSSK